MTSFKQEVIDGELPESKKSHEELARDVTRLAIKHLMLQQQGRRAPGVITWVNEEDSWRGNALAIPELDIDRIYRGDLGFKFYNIDREKDKVIEPTKFLLVKTPRKDMSPRQQIDENTHEFSREELRTIEAMMGKAALLGTPQDRRDDLVIRALVEKHLDLLAETYGDGKELEPDREPYEEKEFIHAAKDRLRGIPGFRDESLSICVSHKFDDEEYFIQISTLCGELEAGAFIKLANDKAVHDTVEYDPLNETNSDYSDFWDLNRLVIAMRDGKEIGTEEFMNIFNSSELLVDIGELP